MSAGGCCNLEKSPAARRHLHQRIRQRTRIPYLVSYSYFDSRSRGGFLSRTHAHTRTQEDPPSLSRKIHEDLPIISLCPVPRGQDPHLLHRPKK